MKLAIPSETADALGATRSGHFGHAPYFTVVEHDGGMDIVGAEAVRNVDHDRYGCGVVIDHVLGLGVDGILTAGMGRPPLMRFTEADAGASLRAAAVSLHERKGIRDVTVAELCREAHVARTTFYARYGNVDEPFAEAEDELVGALLEFLR